MLPRDGRQFVDHVPDGKNVEMTLSILEQAKKLEMAGAFALVLEMMPSESAEFITKNLKIPTIGIGAGAGCDGQILVSDDVLGKYADFCPKFARKYVNLNETMRNAIKGYIDDVLSGSFPNKDESFFLDKEEREKLETYKNS